MLKSSPSLVPVIRAADAAKAGRGKIRLSPEDALLVFGEGTAFTTTFTPRMQIMLPRGISSATAEVVEIIDDTTIRVKKEFASDKGKVTAKFREAGAVDYKSLPFVDQQEMYRHVYESLENNGSIGIFPEGERSFYCSFRADDIV